MPDIECTVWCAGCETEKFRVLRRPIGDAGVFEHVVEPLAGRALPEDQKTCTDCGKQLSRKD